ncbi:hypothetical protein [Mycobacterium sp. URHB0021]
MSEQRPPLPTAPERRSAVKRSSSGWHSERLGVAVTDLPISELQRRVMVCGSLP